jgi:flagellar motor switch protein FliN
MSDSLDSLAEQMAAQGAVEGVTEEVAQVDSNLDEHQDRNLKMILDIPLRVTVELGRTKMVVNELLNLGQGSVIELAKLAGEPMEVLVNDKLIARGEAVVVNEKFGVRLTDIISTKERVEQLK